MLRSDAEKRRSEGIAGGGCDRRQSCPGVYILILFDLFSTNVNYIVEESYDGIKLMTLMLDKRLWLVADQACGWCPAVQCSAACLLSAL